MIRLRTDFPCVNTRFVEEDWWAHHYIYTTVTNDTDQPIYDVAVVAAAYNSDGVLVSVEDDYTISIASSVTF